MLRLRALDEPGLPLHGLARKAGTKPVLSIFYSELIWPSGQWRYHAALGVANL